jgi:hypothetical protein
VLSRAGVMFDADVIARDAVALRAALPAVAIAVETAWSEARAAAAPPR